MNILHICPDYFNTKLYENFFSELNSFELNQKIYVPGVSDYNTKNEYLDIDIQHKSYNLIQRFLFFKKQMDIVKDLQSKNYIEDVKLIHAHNLFSGGYSAYKLNKIRKIPYIVALRNTDVNVFFKYMVNLRDVGNKILNSAEKVIFLSPSYKEKVLNRYINTKFKSSIEKKTVVIPNGIDKLFVNNLYYRKKSLLNKTLKIIYVGSIEKNKNIETTIKSCLELIKNGFNVVFNIVGDVKYKKGEKLIKKYDFINYYGRCSPIQVIRHLRKSDIFVMPSIYETFGLVYAEALSQGLPIIFSKNQGFDGFFKDGEVGYSVNSHNYKEIAKCIINVYDNYLQISNTCTKSAFFFEWDSIAGQYYKLYKNIVYERLPKM